MESKVQIVLRHKPTGLYYSYHAEHTKDLWSAWRYPNEENIAVFLKVHSYAPDNQEEYEMVPVRLTIEELEGTE